MLDDIACSRTSTSRPDARTEDLNKHPREHDTAGIRFRRSELEIDGVTETLVSIDNLKILDAAGQDVTAQFVDGGDPAPWVSADGREIYFWR